MHISPRTKSMKYKKERKKERKKRKIYKQTKRLYQTILENSFVKKEILVEKRTQFDCGLDCHTETFELAKTRLEKDIAQKYF